MKTKLLLVAALSFALLGCGKDPKKDPPPPTVASMVTAKHNDLSENIGRKPADPAPAALEAEIAAQNKAIADWKLTSSEITTDLQQGGRVVRSKATSAGTSTGEVVDNIKVVATINAKLLADAQLSTLRINVEANQGVVTLKGTVKSADLLGRAIGIALGTDGVTQVVSLLTVEV